MKGFSVLIADSNTRLSQLVSQLLDDEPGFRTVGVHGTAEGAVRAAGERRPDVVLLSDRIEGAPVAPLCERLRQVVPGAALIMWSNDPTSQDGVSALADGVVERGTTFRELVHALRTIAERAERQPASTDDEPVPAPATAPPDRAGRAVLDDPDSTGVLLLNCDSCAVQVRIPTEDVSPAVEEARRFFADHADCDTGIDVTDALALTERLREPAV